MPIPIHPESKLTNWSILVIPLLPMLPSDRPPFSGAPPGSACCGPAFESQPTFFPRVGFGESSVVIVLLNWCRADCCCSPPSGRKPGATESCVTAGEMMLELVAYLGKDRGAMKKLFAAMALLALVGTVFLTGCKQEEAPPEPPPTDAPAQP